MVEYGGFVTIAVVPGSFDPMTLGHVDLVSRARTLADEVIVAVAKNSSKTGLLTLDERVKIAEDAVQDIDNVRVGVVPGLLVDFCSANGAEILVKGIRHGGDLDAEIAMSYMNRHLSGIETLFLVADPQYTHIASSLVKDVSRYGGTINDMVTPLAVTLVREAWARQRTPKENGA